MEHYSQVVVPLEMIETSRSHNGDSNENVTDTLTSPFFKLFCGISVELKSTAGLCRS